MLFFGKAAHVAAAFDKSIPEQCTDSVTFVDDLLNALGDVLDGYDRKGEPLPAGELAHQACAQLR